MGRDISKAQWKGATAHELHSFLGETKDKMIDAYKRAEVADTKEAWGEYFDLRDAFDASKARNARLLGEIDALANRQAKRGATGMAYKLKYNLGYEETMAELNMTPNVEQDKGHTVYWLMQGVNDPQMRRNLARMNNAKHALNMTEKERATTGLYADLLKEDPAAAEGRYQQESLVLESMQNQIRSFTIGTKGSDPKAVSDEASWGLARSVLRDARAAGFSGSAATELLGQLGNLLDDDIKQASGSAAQDKIEGMNPVLTAASVFKTIAANTPPGTSRDQLAVGFTKMFNMMNTSDLRKAISTPEQLNNFVAGVVSDPQLQSTLRTMGALAARTPNANDPSQVAENPVSSLMLVRSHMRGDITLSADALKKHKAALTEIESLLDDTEDTAVDTEGTKEGDVTDTELINSLTKSTKKPDTLVKGAVSSYSDIVASKEAMDMADAPAKLGRTFFGRAQLSDAQFDEIDTVLGTVAAGTATPDQVYEAVEKIRNIPGWEKAEAKALDELFTLASQAKAKATPGATEPADDFFLSAVDNVENLDDASKKAIVDDRRQKAYQRLAVTVRPQTKPGLTGAPMVSGKKPELGGVYIRRKGENQFIAAQTFYTPERQGQLRELRAEYDKIGGAGQRTKRTTDIEMEVDEITMAQAKEHMARGSLEYDFDTDSYFFLQGDEAKAAAVSKAPEPVGTVSGIKPQFAEKKYAPTAEGVAAFIAENLTTTPERSMSLMKSAVTLAANKKAAEQTYIDAVTRFDNEYGTKGFSKTMIRTAIANRELKRKNISVDGAGSEEVKQLKFMLNRSMMSPADYAAYRQHQLDQDALRRSRVGEAIEIEKLGISKQKAADEATKSGVELQLKLSDEARKQQAFPYELEKTQSEIDKNRSLTE